ncbi:hypothetical protein F4780DRAFT_749457 [Xylariomycetidae sp. FL0641]|nr:hypothetical protein F4780DRAFT_749457 [Xylariomycetidae sp. FL0641]
MAPRHKIPAKEKPKKPKEQKLETADDFLEAANEHEEAMGKHRAGDGEKAARFASRAIDVYVRGLLMFPKNFDLAYNRARLELEVATHPILKEKMGPPVIFLLRKALESHMYAIELDQDNADVRFNTAQTLTALAEEIAEDEQSSDAEALKFLQNAVQQLLRCFDMQETAFKQSKQELEEAMVDETQNNSPSETDEKDSEKPATTSGDDQEDEDQGDDEEDKEDEDQWVSIVEQVTASTLLETVVAQLHTLATLCSLMSSACPTPGQVPPMAVEPSWVEDRSQEILDRVVPAVLGEISEEELAPMKSELNHAKAVCLGMLLDLKFRLGTIDTQLYTKELENAFGQSKIDLSSEDALMDAARAFMAFHRALVDAGPPKSPEGTTDNAAVQNYASLRWTALMRAQFRITAASKLPKLETETVANTHLLRGDISLCLHGLAYPPTSHPQARETAQQLLKNADVYFRNATKLFGTLGREAAEERAVSELKGGLVKILQQVHTAASSEGSSSSSAQGDTYEPKPATEAQFLETFGGLAKAKGLDWVKDQLDDLMFEDMVKPQLLANVER